MACEKRVEMSRRYPAATKVRLGPNPRNIAIALRDVQPKHALFNRSADDNRLSGVGEQRIADCLGHRGY